MRLRVSEGFIVLFKGYLWMVKGCRHPEGSIVAYPRYKLGSGVKLKSLSESIRVAERLGYLKLDSCLKTWLPMISEDEIDQMLDPYSSEASGKLFGSFRELFNLLRDAAPGHIGVTGSFLASNLIPQLRPRDLDVVVDGVEAGYSVYRVLKELRMVGLTSPAPLDMVGEHEGSDARTREVLLSVRVLEGVYRGEAPYSVRILGCDVVEDVCVERVEDFSGKLRVVEGVRPISMPYIYRTAEGILMVSYRMRFSEIPEGAVLHVDRCRLEEWSSGFRVVSLDAPSCSVVVEAYHIA